MKVLAKVLPPGLALAKDGCDCLWIAVAWDEVKSATIIKSWRKIINIQNTEHHRKFNEGSNENELFDLIM